MVVLVVALGVLCLVALGVALEARARVRHAEQYAAARLRALERRLDEVELARAGPAAPAAPEPVPAPREPVRPEPAAPPPRIPEEERLPGEAPSLPELREAPSRARGPSLEERIGGSWFNWVGILAILFGVAYAMKYSFEQGWVTPLMRFWGGIALGVALLAAGAASDRRSYAILARGFWGGGIGILFVVFFAGFKLLFVDGEPVIGRGVAFAGMAATVAIGAAIAIAFDTRTTAALSAIGGYLVPVLLRTGDPDQVFLFTYLLILTGGLLFLGYWKRWGFLRLLTFAVVIAYFAGWWITEGAGEPWAMLLFPSLFFLFFATEILAWSVWRRMADASLSYVVLGLAATLHGLSGLAVLHDHFTAFRGAFLLLTSAYLLAGARLITRRHEEDRPLALCYGYAAGAFFLLAPAFEASLRGPWIACAWALQGAALQGWGAGGHARGFGYGAFALSAARLLALDTPETLAKVDPYLPFWNERALAYGIVIAAFACGCWRSWRREREAISGAQLATTILWIVALSLPAVLLSLELAQALEAYVSPRFEGATRAYEHQSEHWKTLLWAAYATLAATVLGRRGWTVLRNVALGFGAIVLAKYVHTDLVHTYVAQSTPFLNSRFGVTFALALCLLWCAREFRFVAARGAAHLFLLAGLSMEWVDLSLARAFPGGAEWFGLTILATAYGTGLVARGLPALRPLGAALVGAAGAKFLLLDLPFAGDEAPRLLLQPRFAAGAAAAAACFLAGSRPFPKPIPTLLRLLAHAVAVVALSGETFDLFARHRWNDVLPEAWYPVVALWAVYGAAAMRAGWALERRHLRGLGLVLGWAALGVGLLFLVESGRAPRLLLNARAVGLLAAALGLLLSAEPYRRRAPGRLAAALALAGHGAVMLALTLEAADLFHLAGSERHMRRLSYSLLWAVYAIGMVVGGFLRRYRPVRLMALAVLVGTIVKVFAYDLSFLEGPYRILSFLALGAILVAVSFLYQKYRHVLV